MQLALLCTRVLSACVPLSERIKIQFWTSSSPFGRFPGSLSEAAPWVFSLDADRRWRRATEWCLGMEILWDEASTSFNDWEGGSGEEVEIGQARGYRTLLIHSVTPPSSRSRANETDCDPSPTHQERGSSREWELWNRKNNNKFQELIIG